MILALCGALVIGMSLGLLGSGGSILTVPVLVYILDRPEKSAIAESLAIVGLIALLGTIPYGMRHQINWKSVFFFGIPGIVGAYLGAYASSYIKGTLQLTLFACVMFVVAWAMLFGPSFLEHMVHLVPSNKTTMMGEGLLVGCLTGLLGCGGGFLIVPALIVFNQLAITVAIGTSLMIIAMNAFTGFITQLIMLNPQQQINWEIIAIISGIGILGSFIGGSLAAQIPQVRLRQIFGATIFLMGIYILWRQF